LHAFSVLISQLTGLGSITGRFFGLVRGSFEMTHKR
jgi:hypothetical protein